MARWKAFFSRFGGLIIVLANVVIVLFILWHNPDWREGMGSVFELRPLWLLAALAVPIVCIWIDGLGFTINARRMGAKLRLRDGALVALMGRYYVAITPLGAGGQAAQMVELSRFHLTAGESSSVMSVRYISNQMTHSALSIFAFIQLYPTLSGVMRFGWYTGIFGYLFLPTCMVIFAFSPRLAAVFLTLAGKIFQKLPFIKDPAASKAKFQRTITEYRRGIYSLDAAGWLRMLGLSAVQVILTMGLPALVYYAFELRGASPITMMMQCIILTTAVSLVPTPGNAGVAEGGFYYLFQSYFPPDSLVSAMLLWRLAGYYLLLLIGMGTTVIRLIRKPKKKVK